MSLGGKVPRWLWWGSSRDKRRRLGRQVDALSIAADPPAIAAARPPTQREFDLVV